MHTHFWNKRLSFEGFQSVIIPPFSGIKVVLCNGSNTVWFIELYQLGTYLKKIQIKPTDTWTLCKETVETIVHLFFECGKATHLWNELHCRILDVIYVDVNFTLKTVLFGEISYTCYKPINIILLATREYLYTFSKKEKIEI